jgi:23S rRNA (adenine2503-C2)-methyltransferase
LFCRNFPVKINHIEYNQVHYSGFTGADPQKVKLFIQFLSYRNLVVNLRKSRGNDIDAACGQLALKYGGKIMK